MNYRLSLILVILILAACTGGESTPPPTEFRVVTNEANSPDLQATITFLETRQAQPLASPTLAQNNRAPIGRGVIINGDAVMFAEADPSASEVGIVPLDSEILVFEQTEPNRIGLVFYNIQYEGLLGWIASTQIQELEEVAIQAATAVPLTPTPTYTPSPSPSPTQTITPLPQGFPTPEVYSVVLVEQLFERGRMIWFEPLRQIWVLEGQSIDPKSGTWTCYLDEYLEGQPANDPTMNPPAGITTASQFPDALPQQPIRGFGRIWRENDDLRASLGWAITTETKYTSRYEYRAGGEMDGRNYVPGAGEYRISSLYQRDLILSEDLIKAPCQDKTGTWRTE